MKEPRTIEVIIDIEADGDDPRYCSLCCSFMDLQKRCWWKGDGGKYFPLKMEDQMISLNTIGGRPFRHNDCLKAEKRFNEASNTTTNDNTE